MIYVIGIGWILYSTYRKRKIIRAQRRELREAKEAVQAVRYIIYEVRRFQK